MGNAWLFAAQKPLTEFVETCDPWVVSGCSWLYSNGLNWSDIAAGAPCRAARSISAIDYICRILRPVARAGLVVVAEQCLELVGTCDGWVVPGCSSH